MSQHFYTTKSSAGKPVQVLMGWDRPMQDFFMVVSDLAFVNPEDEYLYSNLADPEIKLGSTQLEYFLSKLAELQINVPRAMVQQVQFDCIGNIGNHHIDHSHFVELGPLFRGVARERGVDELLMLQQPMSAPLQVVTKGVPTPILTLMPESTWTIDTIRAALSKVSALKVLEDSELIKEADGAHVYLGEEWIGCTGL